MDSMQEIIAVEESLRIAMLDSDIHSLDELLSNDLVFTNHLGFRISKDDDLNSHKNGDFKFYSINCTNQQVKIYSDTAIVSVTVNITGEYKGSEANGIFCFTRVWYCQREQWKVVAGHSCVAA